MADEKPIDPRLQGFKQYLDEKVTEQDARPYGERQDIAEVLGLCARARGIYQDLINLARGRSNTPITNLDLSARAYNCLEYSQIHTLGDLTDKTEEELLNIRSFRRTNLVEVKKKLADLGMHLKGDESYLVQHRSKHPQGKSTDQQGSKS